jgi:GTP-binding protein
MEIHQVHFVMSNSSVKLCPPANLPEYAFIGRSNVGKSSLINMLMNRKSLAKVSGNPGKTKLINHFLVNNKWFLADLPGYGYAKVSKTDRVVFHRLINSYILQRDQLICLFVLIDLRHPPQAIDLEFMEHLAENSVPFVIAFTKADKLKPQAIRNKVEEYFLEMSKFWEAVPLHFVSSAETGMGREEILDYIEQLNKDFLIQKDE